MRYQTKWMTNMLKLFISWQFSLLRALLVGGLLIGCLGVALGGLQQSLLNAQARPATPQHSGKGRSVSITISSHIDHQIVTYMLVIRTAVHADIIRQGMLITFTDNIPVGLSHVSAGGSSWNINVSSKVSPSLVTGTYEGGYPISPGTALTAVIIRGTINNYADSVLTNSASVDSWGNTDNTYISDNINLVSPQSNDNSGTCDINCKYSKKSACDKSCKQQVSDACDTQCKGSQSTASACDTQCKGSQSTASACDTQCKGSQSTASACDTQCESSQSASGACDTQCGQLNPKASIQRKTTTFVHKSMDTYCECDQQDTSNSIGSSTSTTITESSADDPSRKGLTAPFPSMPNTGSDPN